MDASLSHFLTRLLSIGSFIGSLAAGGRAELRAQFVQRRQRRFALRGFLAFAGAPRQLNPEVMHRALKHAVVIRSGGGRFGYMDSGKITTSPADPMGRRLDKLFRELQRIAQSHHVTRCAVESGFVGKSAVSALKLGQARAAAVLAAEVRNIPVMDVTPREIKMAITGRGSAAKTQVGYMVSRILGIEFDRGEEDISDALAAALCCAMRDQSAARVPPR